MLRAAIVFALSAGFALGADHPENTEVILGASGSLTAKQGSPATDAGLMRREGEHDSPAHDDERRQPVTNAPHRVPIAMHKQELLQVDLVTAAPNEESTAQTTADPLVSCGGHQASKCGLCTVIDPVTGLETLDRGPDWCHGDCTYFDGECHTLTAQNLGTERDAGYANVSTTKLVPDLMNPEITQRDKDIMDAAADKSVEEAEYEAKQRLSNQEEAEKEKKGKFLLTVIVSASCVLFLCAVGSMIALWKYIKKGQPKTIEEPLTADDGASEDDGEDDGEGGEEGEAPAES